MKTYVFDLDGTLCDTEGSNYLEAKPFQSRIDTVNALYDAGHTIIIDTARGCVSGAVWFNKTVEQLKEWGLKFHSVRAGIKLHADVYVDDKAQSPKDFFMDGPQPVPQTQSLNKESGSGIQTNVMIVSRVIKEATNDRVDKLVDEIYFLENMPDEFRPKFSKIVFSRHEPDSNKMFYEMEHYNLPTLRRLILSEELSVDEIRWWTEKVVDFSTFMYDTELLPNISNAEYMYSIHWSRFTSRLHELTTKSAWFHDHAKAVTIYINGNKYLNLLPVVDKLRRQESWFYPEHISRWGHNDLHFSNILVDRASKQFKLIDPRGYAHCDYYYDYGKLWHSVNGKYELIADGSFTISDAADEHSFAIHQNGAYNLLEGSRQNLMEILQDYSDEGNDNIEMKTEFNEVMHFMTLIPFLLEFDLQEKRARAAYYQSVMLANNFLVKYGVSLS